MLTLWTALAWRAWVAERVPAAAVAAALAVACCALLIAQQTPQLADKAPDSALAAVVGRRSSRTELRALTDLPVISPRTPHRRGARAQQRAARRAAARRRRARRRDRDADPPRPLRRPADRHARAGCALPAPAGRRCCASAARLPCGVYVVTQDARMSASAGRSLLEGLLGVLRRHHPFRPVAGAPGYRVFRLGC